MQNMPDGARAVPDDILKGLNSAQKEAVRQTDGPLLIVAGAGTGKTRTLISRMAYIIQNGLARPWEVFMVTFTNKAANELKTRIQNLIDVDPSELTWVGTFHSMSAKILRREAERVGLNTNFSIIDDRDQQKVIKELLDREKIDKKEWTPRHLASLINHWKNDARLPDDLNDHEKKSFGGKAFKLYQMYQSELQVSNCADFGDLILHVVKIFAENGGPLAEYQDKFIYFMVDEYQDTNICQYQLIRLLTQKKKNLCCVGDDDQAIYSWRGAKPQIMLDFSNHFTGARILRLEENYRSSFHILKSAVGLIQNNLYRHGKSLRMAEPTSAGAHKIRVHSYGTPGQEARFVADNVRRLTDVGVGARTFDLSEIAVAARTWSQTADIEEKFMELQIPYRVVGGPKFYDRREIKDALGYLKLIHNPADGVAFDRIVNTPPRGIGKVTVERISQFASEHGIAKLDAARQMVAENALGPAAARRVGAFASNVDHWSDQLLVSDAQWVQKVTSVFEEVGFPDYLKKNFPDDFTVRMDNQAKLAEMAGRFDSLDEYIEHISLLNEDSTQAKATSSEVTLMTLHASKGSEYPVMHLIGWNEGGLPWIRSLEDALQNRSRTGYELAVLLLRYKPRTVDDMGRFFRRAKDAVTEMDDPSMVDEPDLRELCNLILKWDRSRVPDDIGQETELARRLATSEELEEERRLAHVGITRVKELCYISYSTTVLLNGQMISNLQASRFIKELPPESVEFYVNGRLMSGARRGHFQPRHKQAAILTKSPQVGGGVQNGANHRAERINEGHRVKHPTFGNGTVMAASNNRLMIKFDNKTEKLILAEYVAKI